MIVENTEHIKNQKQIDKQIDKQFESERLLLWMATEKNLASSCLPEDLRTSGLISAERRNWPAAVLRLEEAVQWGVRDLQTLDAFGEAAYQAKVLDVLLPFAEFYQDPMIAVHMARAYLILGDYKSSEEFLRISNDGLLKQAIAAVGGVAGSIEKSIAVMTTPLMYPFENLNLIEYWQALAVIADVAKRSDLVEFAEIKLMAYAYERSIIHFNQALRLLATCEFSAGWKMYDWRLVPPSPCGSVTACSNLPMWEGEIITADQKLLVVLEFGFGDQIFSLRFVKALISKNINIEIAVCKELFKLVQFSFPEQKVHELSTVKDFKYPEQLQKPNYWVYAFSIPARTNFFDPVAKPILAQKFLVMDPKITAQKMEIIKKINPHQLPVFAITWHGDIITVPMRSRAYSLSEFLSQTEILNKPCVIISLQKDITAAEAEQLSVATAAAGCVWINTSDSLTDFSQTAAWQSCCDHIFSCDTAVAHLAGALGLPTTVLIRNKSIWHWQKANQKASHADQSIWYDSVNVRYALTPQYSYMFDIRDLKE